MSDQIGSDTEVQLVIAEYQSVAGLIEYFREVELKALGGAGLVLSVVAAGYAAENTKEGQAVLLVIAAWVPAVSLLVVLMATLRGFRAVVYMQRVHPLARKLTGEDSFLAYEVHADALFETTLGRQKTRLPIERIARWLVPGVPVMLLIALASVLLAVSGYVIRPERTMLLIGGGGALLAVLLAIVGVKFTLLRRDYADKADWV